MQRRRVGIHIAVGFIAVAVAALTPVATAAFTTGFSGRAAGASGPALAALHRAVVSDEEIKQLNQASWSSSSQPLASASVRLPDATSSASSSSSSAERAASPGTGGGRVRPMPVRPLGDDGTGVVPRNVSDTYRGQWQRTPINATLASAEDAAATSKLVVPLDQATGSVVLQLANKDTSLKQADFVYGDISFRDGQFSTDPGYRVVVEGMYFWGTGKLVLLGLPASAISKGVSDPENPLSSPSLTLAEKVDHPRVREQVCVFKFSFNVQTSKVERRPVTEREMMAGSARDPMRLAVGQGFSPNCGMVFDFDTESIQLSEYFYKAMMYVMAMSGSTLLQLYLVMKQMDIAGSQAHAAKVSLLTIGMQSVMDSYLCLIHLTVGILIEPLFEHFALMSFLKFIIFSVFEMRYLLVIWKARRPREFAQDSDSMRREFSKIYSRFYMFLVLGIILYFQMASVFHLFLLLVYSFWIPQIVCNATRGTNNAFSSRYVIGMSVTRLMIPSYFYGCPHNMVHAAPNSAFVFVLWVYVGTQAMVLLMQDAVGPQFFVPARFIPEKYNYYRDLPESITRQYEDDGSEVDCIICMVPVMQQTFMVTPCNHAFHSACLQRWMDIKMECPTCREPLPPP